MQPQFKRFHKLNYAGTFILDSNIKAKRIKKRANSKSEERPKEQNIADYRSKHFQATSKSMKRARIQLVKQLEQNTGQLVEIKKPKNQPYASSSKRIPCKGCSLPYYSENLEA